MRIIIAGGREFNDYDLLKSETIKCIKQLKQEGFEVSAITITIVCGKARGADTLGENFGKEYGLNIKYFIPDWDGLGKSAGYRRNADMALYAKEDNGVLISFWDKVSKGTKHMIDLANKHGLRVFVVNY